MTSQTKPFLRSCIALLTATVSGASSIPLMAGDTAKGGIAKDVVAPAAERRVRFRFKDGTFHQLTYKQPSHHA